MKKLGKYQPKFRSHFRFRTLHVILMECFSLLPEDSFPNSCQQLFVEALRVFRDAISSCFETSSLNEFMHDDQNVLKLSSFSTVNGFLGVCYFIIMIFY
jgi:hypothetical protein